MDLSTKEGRQSWQNAQFNALISRGHSKQEYKGLHIFTKDEGGKFYLEIFRDGAAHSIANYYYRTAEQREAGIERYKENYDRNKEYKAKQKENDKLSKAQAEEKAKNGETPRASVQKTSYLVKKLLKEKLNLEVSVRSESYTGGSSINVSWNLGADEKEVEKLIGELSFGTFDGMTDCAGSRETVPVIVDGFHLATFRHLFARQEMSEDFKFKLVKFVSDNMKFDGAFPLETPDQLRKNFPQMVWGAWEWSNLFYRMFQYCSWATQDESKINLISVHFSKERNGQIYFIYEVDGVQYNTEEVPTTEKPTPTRPEKKEVETGKVQIISYSEKAIAVIGDTYPIKDKLKELGGKFNKFLSCGAGWIFRKSDLEKIKEALKPKEETRTIEDAKAELKEEVQKTIDFFEATDKKLFGIVTPQTEYIKLLNA